MHPGFPFGALRDEVERPGEGEGGGVVAGHQEGDDVVDEILVGHGLPRLGIGSARQLGEEVVAAGAGAAGSHQVADRAAQAILMAAHALAARPRQPVGKSEERISHPPVDRAVVVGVALLDGLKHLRRAADEHGVGDHVEGGAHHVGVDRTHCGIRAAPFRHHLLRRGGHCGTVAERAHRDGRAALRRRAASASPCPRPKSLRCRRPASAPRPGGRPSGIPPAGREARSSPTSGPVRNTMRGGPGASTTGLR